MEPTERAMENDALPGDAGPLGVLFRSRDAIQEFQSVSV